MKVLDVGCGSDEDPTTKAAWFTGKKAEVTTVDKRPGKADIIADVHSLPMLLPKSYDIVTASEILEHLDYPSMALKEWRRVLKDDGQIWLTIPNPFRGTALLDALRGMETAENPEHRSAWHLGLLRQLLALNGFKVIEAKYFTRSRYRKVYVRAAHRAVAFFFPAIGNENIMVKAVKT